MELRTPNNNGGNPKPDPESLHDDDKTQHQTHESQVTSSFFDDIDSTCSTPYVSAPSSPGRGSGNGGFYYSAPASPMHFVLTSSYAVMSPDNNSGGGGGGLGFEFGSGSTATGSWMSSADELFLNGKIRPMKLSTHLEKPQVLAPLLDLENEEEEESEELDFLRSKSEGRSNNKYFWLPTKEKKQPTNTNTTTRSSSKEKDQQISASSISTSTTSVKKNKPVNGILTGKKRRVPPPSPHELHYTANRAQAEEMKKKTFLPYKQGLLGCLGFTSKGYGAMNAKGPPVQRKPLKHRDYIVDLESRLGKTQVVTPIAPLSQQAGYYCSVCECVVKDSANYLDHINGKKHQRALGMSMRVERASLDQVRERFDMLKKRKVPGSFTEQESAECAHRE
ncbi:hypothetical protein EZV62_006577 [Acer yangbiense]|uniref:U1-type domain-containing protein n=1 Tax=Acer yangbiense TaxID=1000413 RepID=A0A5C7I9F8_9ROSI|nr:hypothetical protein EZV62_006577 [Acer yangbiense]